jgi:phosphatidate phosphatase APP1
MNRNPGARRACFLLFILFWAWSAAARELEDGDRVLFFPDIAVLDEETATLRVWVKSWAYEEESREFALWAAARALGIALDQRAPEEKARFRERARYFRTDSERGVRLFVRLADVAQELPETNPAGRADGEFRIPARILPDSRKVHRLAFVLDAPGHPQDAEEGYAWYAPPEGVSVVSDIDDTIKVSQVRDRALLMENTFLKPFVAVPGAAAWYREMARELPEAAFHYLSASPLQLAPALQDFLTGEGFPPGSLHLRESTAWHNLTAGQKTTRTHKTQEIERLFSLYPKRRFILIGDSGEQDANIYADLARRHPGRVIAIHIRDADGGVWREIPP